MRFVFASLWLIVALPAAAASFADRYPAGSIKDRAQAEAALRDVDAEQARVDRETKARDAECLKRFLVNRCRDEVRRDKLNAERELRRVRGEAHDLQRALDAQEAARKRAGTAAEAAQPPRAGAPRSAEPKSGRTIRPEEETARSRAAAEAREADHAKRVAKDAANAAERTDSAREYAEKQAEAARRAEESAAQRKKTEQRRAERRKQLEAQEAQREEVRRKAEDAAGAGK